MGHLLVVAHILTMWKCTVDGSQTERANILPLWLLIPFEAFVGIECFTSLTARLCWGIIDPDTADGFLP